uniref:Uncharacterized protein n=1 Tax=Sphaerodactylus townsendi TaxID=933632 RepID=A0ACB8EQI5_9SAUR
MSLSVLLLFTQPTSPANKTLRKVVLSSGQVAIKENLQGQATAAMVGSGERAAPSQQWQWQGGGKEPNGDVGEAGPSHGKEARSRASPGNGSVEIIGSHGGPENQRASWLQQHPEGFLASAASTEDHLMSTSWGPALQDLPQGVEMPSAASKDRGSSLAPNSSCVTTRSFPEYDVVGEGCL